MTSRLVAAILVVLAVVVAGWPRAASAACSAASECVEELRGYGALNPNGLDAEELRDYSVLQPKALNTEELRGYAVLCCTGEAFREMRVYAALTPAASGSIGSLMMLGVGQ